MFGFPSLYHDTAYSQLRLLYLIDFSFCGGVLLNIRIFSSGNGAPLSLGNLKTKRLSDVPHSLSQDKSGTVKSREAIVRMDLAGFSPHLFACFLIIEDTNCRGRVAQILPKLR